MEETHIKRIKAIKTELNALVVELAPASTSEWDGFAHLYAASRDMRRINIDKLGQLPLPKNTLPASELQEPLPLSDSAAVQAGEDSLTERIGSDAIQAGIAARTFDLRTPEKTGPALNTTGDDEFNRIPSEGKRRRTHRLKEA